MDIVPSEPTKDSPSNILVCTSCVEKFGSDFENMNVDHSKQPNRYCLICGVSADNSDMDYYLIDESVFSDKNFFEVRKGARTPTEFPTVLYALCTPGLSDFLEEKMSTKNKRKFDPKNRYTGEMLQSLHEDSSTMKRSSFVRRELKFEFTNSNTSLAKKTNAEAVDNKRSASEYLRKKLGNVLSLRRRKSRRMSNIVTSTPINFLDDNEPDASNQTKNIRNWRESMRGHYNEPAITNTEKFQCAHCKKAWTHNFELLDHVMDAHQGFRYWFQRSYQCGLCSTKFFINRFFARHCCN